MSKLVDVYLSCRTRYIDTFSLKGESADMVREVLTDCDIDEIESVFSTIFEEGEDTFDLRGQEVEGCRAGVHMAFGDDISIFLDEDMEDPVVEEIDSCYEYELRKEESSKDASQYPYGLNIPENFKIDFDDPRVWVENAVKAYDADDLDEKLRNKLLMPFYDEGLCLYTVEKQRCQFKVSIELDDDEELDVEKLKFVYCYNDTPSTTNDDDEEVGVPAMYEGEFALRSVFYNNKAYDLEVLDMSGSGARNYATNDLFEGNVIYE